MNYMLIFVTIFAITFSNAQPKLILKTELPAINDFEIDAEGNFYIYYAKKPNSKESDYKDAHFWKYTPSGQRTLIKKKKDFMLDVDKKGQIYAFDIDKGDIYLLKEGNKLEKHITDMNSPMSALVSPGGTIYYNSKPKKSRFGKFLDKAGVRIEIKGRKKSSSSKKKKQPSFYQYILNGDDKVLWDSPLTAIVDYNDRVYFIDPAANSLKTFPNKTHFNFGSSPELRVTQLGGFIFDKTGTIYFSHARTQKIIRVNREGHAQQLDSPIENLKGFIRFDHQGNLIGLSKENEIYQLFSSEELAVSWGEEKPIVIENEELKQPEPVVMKLVTSEEEKLAKCDAATLRLNELDQQKPEYNGADAEIKQATYNYFFDRSEHILKQHFRAMLDGNWGGQGALPSYSGGGVNLVAYEPVTGVTIENVDKTVLAFFALESVYLTQEKVDMHNFSEVGLDALGAKTEYEMFRNSSTEQRNNDAFSAMLWEGYGAVMRAQERQKKLSTYRLKMFESLETKYGKPFRDAVYEQYTKPQIEGYSTLRLDRWFEADYLNAKQLSLTGLAKNRKRIEQLHYLLDSGRLSDAQKSSKLWLECNRGRWYRAKLILSRNVDPNVLTPEGTTALHEVCESGDSKVNLELATLLMQHGASLSVADKHGKYPTQVLDKMSKMFARNKKWSNTQLRALLRRLSQQQTAVAEYPEPSGRK